MKFSLLVLVMATWVAGCEFLAPHIYPSDDSGLGAGLLFFLILGFVATAGALLDGLFEPRYERLIVRWVIVSVGVAASFSLIDWSQGEFGSVAAVVRDFADTGPFLTIYTAAPALVLGWLGWMARGRKLTTAESAR